MATKKKRNPQDTTLRNIDALKKRVLMLERKVKILIAAFKEHQLFNTTIKDEK